MNLKSEFQFGMSLKRQSHKHNVFLKGQVFLALGSSVVYTLTIRKSCLHMQTLKYWTET